MIPTPHAASALFRRSTLWLLGPLLVGVWATRAILQHTNGEPVAPLDDAYIHFQYARSFAEGRPFEYTPGASPSPGATSLLWPLVLAPFFAIGVQGSGIVWVAWSLGWLSLAGLAYETRMLCRGLAEEPAPTGAGLLVLGFGAFAWFAGSAMEVVPFAWLLTRTARRSADWVEHRGARYPCGALELAACAFLCPLARPEGALGSLLVAIAWMAAPPQGRRALASIPVLAVAGPIAVNAAATGSVLSTTATAKWLLLNPYYQGESLYHAVSYHLRLLFGTLLDGELWTQLFIPTGGRVIAWLALAALAWGGFRSKKWGRAGCAAVVALGALIPTTYETFLVNRVRYLWPFAPAWFVGVAVLCDAVGQVSTRLGGRRALVSGLAVGVLVLLFASRLPRSIDDLATSAAAIQAQQVALGKWARRELPPDSIVGVNDTGAIAYFGEKRTFDIVGLTTRGEARYWAAGPGSRFEHYERLSPARLPSLFIVYPEWFGIDVLLGERLTERTVRHTILGGPTMVAFRARYDLLGTGNRPLEEPPSADLIDVLDVADLESEAKHEYALLGATQHDNAVVTRDGRADGGRASRTSDRFVMKVASGGRLVARWGAPLRARIRVLVAGEVAAELALPAIEWHEVHLSLSTGIQGGDLPVVVEAIGRRTFDSLHYWSYRKRSHP